MSKVAIIDYRMGNLFSVVKKIRNLSSEVIITSNVEEIESSDKIILPGVGHFGKAMSNLKELGLIKVLNTQVLENKKPILGICLGMQIMAQKSEEGNTDGLGWIDAEIVKFNVKGKLKYKVPHTGWNQIKIAKESKLMKNIKDLSEVYFVHAYHLKTSNQSIILNETDYEYNFPSAFEVNNIYGVQYHPEKSHDLGATILKNFIDL